MKTMPFVKLDCGMLDSTIWFDKAARDVFITSLLMAEPKEVTSPEPQLEVCSTNLTGWSVPPGWYGFVRAAGIGIVSRAGIDQKEGLSALERLGNPEPESRTPDFEGRRMVRVSGGYIILNYMRYRERDYTTAERSRRYRLRKMNRDKCGVTRDITQAEAEAEAEAEGEEININNDEIHRQAELIYQEYPRKVGKPAALKAIVKAIKTHEYDYVLEQTKAFARIRGTVDLQFIAHPSTWFNQQRYNDNHETWVYNPPKPSGGGWQRPIEQPI